MKTNRRLLIIPAAAVAVVALLFGAYYQQPQITSIQETNSNVAAETFDVTPTSMNVDTVEFDATVASSIVVPVTTNIESDAEAANFILPFLNEAYAVTSTQTSLTNKEWQSLPSPGTNSLAYDAANDDIWFAGHGTNKVIRLDLTSGTLTQWPVISGVDVTAVALDPTGRVYFAMGAQEKLGRLDPAANSIIEWFLPSAGFANKYISQVVYDPISGHVVYMRTASGNPSSNDFRIGKLNPSSNQITEWTTLCTNSASTAWCVERFGLDPVNGDIYFFEESTNTMKRIRPSAPTTLTSWAVPQPGANIIGVTVNSAQTVFAAENGGNRILRLVTTGPSVNQVTQWLVPTAGFQPFSITTSPTDEAVYFTEYNAGKIGRIVPSSNLFTEWTLPTAGLRPTQVITDASGNLYWSVDNAGRIGRLS